MRNLLALFGAVLLTFAVVGWYLDWYKIQSRPSADGHRKFSIDINGPKISEDLSKGQEKLKHALESKEKKPAAEPGPAAIPAAPGKQGTTAPREGDNGGTRGTQRPEPLELPGLAPAAAGSPEPSRTGTPPQAPVRIHGGIGP
jgi:hypothetical protein